MESPNLDFYSTAAQIMPVLFIALVIETIRRDRKPVRTSLLVISAAALVTEALSLQVLASGNPSNLKATVIGECLWIAGIFLILRILLQAFTAIATDEGERDDTNAVAATGAIILIVGIIVIALL
jgi:hypothetical protein